MRFTSLSLACVLLIAASSLLGLSQPAQPQDVKEPKTEAKQPEKQPDKKTEPAIDKTDEEILRRADLSTDPAALLAFLRKRTLAENERAAVELQVRRLGAGSFPLREKATFELIKRGPAALDVLRSSTPTDLELKRRIENIIARIHEADVAAETVPAAVRVLAVAKPKELVEALLQSLPFTDNDAAIDEMRYAIVKNALVDGKAHPLLVAALADRSAIRRASAAEAIGRTAYAEHKDALKKLLTDKDVMVRYRTARALALAKERDAIPAIIDALPELPVNDAWRAEDFLLQLAGKTPPPEDSMGDGAAARKKCADGWRAWWKQHGAKADLAALEESPRMLGRTLIVMLDQREIFELGADKMPRWEVKNINFPLDAQLLGEDRILIAEYNSNRVIERTIRGGDVVWHRAVTGPLVAQRLANGNTFVATATNLLEYDKDQNEVLNVSLSDDGLQVIMKAVKLPSGEIICMLANSRIVRFDERGNEKSSFPISIGMKLFGGRIQVQPNGRVLVPHNAEGKVVEYDKKGKLIWEVQFEQPIAAMRLPNGNTLITSMNPAVGAVEVDRTGAEVWTYRHSSNTRATRAIRR